MTMFLCGLLVAVIWIIFGRTVGYGFVNYDDDTYVYHNLMVARGLSLDGLAWAFTHTHSANWHPLTWISHMIDCQLWNLNPAGHHFINVLLHTIGAISLFLVLSAMTKAVWPSALVAALFAIHPLHVESVAWIAERKDVLSGVFFFLTLASYIYYVRKPGSLGRYALLAVVFALGLMCKPTLVTTPFVLLLLDFWPLQRVMKKASAAAGGPREEVPHRFWIYLVLEKVPLLVLSAACCVATILAQKGAISVVASLPFSSRVANALTSYVVYIWQTIWPLNLAVLYPHPEDTLPFWQVALAFCLLALITTAAMVVRRTRPYFIVGWLWYAGMLVPMIGLVQVGLQAHADRYTYLPLIGLAIAIVWGLGEVFSTSSRQVKMLGRITGGAILVFFMWSAIRQTAHWHDAESLWNHTLRVTSENAAAHINFGNFYMDAGRFDDAAGQFQQAVDISRSRSESSAGATVSRQTFADAENNLGLALGAKGAIDGARAQFEHVLARLPNDPKAHLNLGTLFFKQGRLDSAIEHYTASLNAYRDNASALFNLGNALLGSGKIDEAIARFQQALEINPGFTDAENNLAVALVQKGMVTQAIHHWENVLQLQPTRLDTLNNLAWMLATSPDKAVRDGNKAVMLSQRAEKIDGKSPSIQRTLAAGYAETGNFGDAQRVARSAVGLAESTQNRSLADVLRSDLALYELNLPVRSPTESRP